MLQIPFMWTQRVPRNYGVKQTNIPRIDKLDPHIEVGNRF